MDVTFYLKKEINPISKTTKIREMILAKSYKKVVDIQGNLRPENIIDEQATPFDKVNYQHEYLLLEEALKNNVEGYKQWLDDPATVYLFPQDLAKEKDSTSEEIKDVENQESSLNEDEAEEPKLKSFNKKGKK